MAQAEETVRTLTSETLLPLSAETDVIELVCSQSQTWRKNRMKSGRVGEDSGKYSWESFTVQ